MLKVEFVKEKETKNTVRFQEVEVDGYPKVGTIYVPKATLAMNGIKAEDGFYMILEPKTK